MEPEFWHQKWASGETAFHEQQANPLLVENFTRLALPSGSRVFVPLCGKSLDIAWLLAQGCQVAGAELSQTAIDQLFAQLRTTPAVTPTGGLRLHSADGIDIFVGDIFSLSAQALGPIAAVYDRAALVALPADMRVRYTAHLRAITATAPQLLVTYEYDQSVQPGPPFSVSPDEVHRHYDQHYTVTQLSTYEVPGGLKGKCRALEHVWLLSNR